MLPRESWGRLTGSKGVKGWAYKVPESQGWAYRVPRGHWVGLQGPRGSRGRSTGS